MNNCWKPLLASGDKLPMKSLIFITLAISLLFIANPSPAQPKNPPKEFTIFIGMNFVWIPPGTFQMGSPKDEHGRSQDEILHKVTLTRGFYLGVTTVTQEQWLAVMGANPSFHKGEKNLPVECVSWDDCQVFLEKLSKKEGQVYRLPTEAEWEYACRAGTTTPFYFGDNITSDSMVNFNGNYPYRKGIGSARNRTTQVGIFPANAWGLFDMHGNVMQWCADSYLDYPQGAVVDPHDPYPEPARVAECVKNLSSPQFAERQAATKTLKEIGRAALPALRKAAANPPDLETQRRVEQIMASITNIDLFHVVRGGSFNSPAANVRSAHRFKLGPTERYFSVGFRVALTPGQ